MRRLRGTRSPSSFLPAAPLLDAPFPPQGPSGQVPPLRWYYEALRLPAGPPARWLIAAVFHSVALASTVPLQCPGFALVGAGTLAPTSLEDLFGLPQARLYWGGDGRVSQVPGGSLCAFAVVFDPGRALAPGH